LQLLLKGEVWVDERSVLEARFTTSRQGRQFPDQSFWALNDVVVARGEVARIITYRCRIDGQPLTNYRADGVILATATGSTGYALAAGGPVLRPQAEEFVLVPIVPHLSAGFNLVLPKTAVVKLLIRNTYPSVLNIDGHTSINLPDEARVTVTNCAYKVYFLRLKPKVSFIQH
jgi:NAD+ kinase